MGLQTTGSVIRKWNSARFSDSEFLTKTEYQVNDFHFLFVVNPRNEVGLTNGFDVECLQFLTDLQLTVLKPALKVWRREKLPEKVGSESTVISRTS